MRASVIAAIVAAVVLILAAGVGTGLFGFFMLAVALNGFVGKPLATDVAMYGYMGFATLSILLAAVLAAIVIFLLAARRMWNAAGAGALATLTGMVGVGVLHAGCFIVAVIVAVVLYG
jgi:hypothetical protein